MQMSRCIHIQILCKYCLAAIVIAAYITYIHIMIYIKLESQPHSLLILVDVIIGQHFYNFVEILCTILNVYLLLSGNETCDTSQQKVPYVVNYKK